MRRSNQNVFEYLLSRNSLGKVNKSRVNDYCRNRFPKPGQEKDPVGKDKQIRAVARQYVWDREWMDEVEKHLDDVDYGPRQVAGSHEQNLSNYQSRHAAPFTWCRNYQRAVKVIIENTKPRKPLSPLEFTSDWEIKDALPREDTHAGIVYFETGKRYKGEYLEGASEKLRIEQDLAISQGSFNTPLIIGERYQCSGGYSEQGLPLTEVKYKERTIHMYMIWLALTELQFSKSAQKHLGTMAFYAGGKKPGELFQLINRMRFATTQWVSIDYSKYDQTIPGWLIDGAFRVVKSWFGQMSERQDKLWNIVVNDFIHKGFVGPQGEILYCDDGVPSGSMFTQIIDTICNLIMLQTFAFSQGWEGKLLCNICGDDNLIFHNGWFNKDVYASYIGHNFGIEIQPTKCAEGSRYEHPEYLSRFWTYSGVYRNPCVLLAHMMFPERYRDYKRNKDMSAEMIFYSYYLAYQEGMREAFDMDRFLHDNWTHVKSLSERAMSELPGFLKYQVRYEGLKL